MKGQIFDKCPEIFTTPSVRSSQVHALSPLQLAGEPTRPKEIIHQLFFRNQQHCQVEPLNDLYSSLKPLIILGRIALIVPCSRHDSKSYKRPSFSLKAIPILATIFLLCHTLFKLIFDVQPVLNQSSHDKLGLMNYITNMQFVIDTSMSAFLYLYFLRHSDKFYKIFDKWSELSSQTGLVKDTWLCPLAYFATICITTASLASLGLVLSDAIANIKAVTQSSNLQISASEALYKIRMPGLHKIIPYNPILYNFHLGCIILEYLTMTYISLLLILFSRAMSFQFRKLVEDATGMEYEEAHTADLRDTDRLFWENLVSKYRALCMLVKTMNNFLSPLIFCWISWNIYALSVQLYRAMVTTELMGVQKQTFVIQVITRTTRFLASIISAAQVSSYAKKILMVLRNCPKEHYHDAEVYRLELGLMGQSIGFTGLGCFGLTKPFLLSVFSAMFTMEIILLQSTTR